MEKQIRLPMMATRGAMLFPETEKSLEVGRSKSVAAVNYVADTESPIFLANQKDVREQYPQREGLYDMGIIAEIRLKVSSRSDSMTVSMRGLQRAKLIKIEEGVECEMAVIEPQEDYWEEELWDKEADGPSAASTGMMRAISAEFGSLTRMKGGQLPQDFFEIMYEQDYNLSSLIDYIALEMDSPTRIKQEILDENRVGERFEKLYSVLKFEKQVILSEKKLESTMRKEREEETKTHYLKRKLAAIKKELGEDGDGDELASYRKKLAEKDLPEEAREAVQREISKIQNGQVYGADLTVSLNYISTLLDLPWNEKSDAKVDINNAEKVLDKDHYGMKEVKERILEYLSVVEHSGKLKGPIICLVGPPGTGKTSIGRSIAEASGRKFIRMSLGGLKDEAEIRGHRRTYVGAIPGRIINSIKKVGVNNPVLLLDEIDKVGNDYRGDPADALLEVLDPEQNSTFTDHFLEVAFDLSDVMFITTANSMEGIPAPLRDRMEVIEVSGYTVEEKLQIAKRHLVKKAREENGLTGKEASFTDGALLKLIESYTLESGVRELYRQISSVCRKLAKKIVTGDAKSVRVGVRKLEDLLGKEKYRKSDVDKSDEVGMINGLSVSMYGGSTLGIEVNVMPGEGKLILTGQLGDVMQESVKAGVGYLRSQTEKYDLPEEFYKNKDIHVHVPAGSTPKDGPSAGIAICLAIYSALTGKKIRGDIAITGEITLRGKALPVGGIKEKLLAAHRAGLKLIMLPKENEADLEELPDNVKDKTEIVFIESVDDAMKHAIVK